MGDTIHRILITGGMGYVGGRLANYLSEHAPELCLRLMTRRPQEEVPPWAAPMDVVRGDVLEEQSLTSALEGVDTVIHLAAANEIDCQRDPDLALEVNGRGTYRLLQACRQQGVERLIYFSTFHVYGPGAPQVIDEDTPTRPIHPYSITHHLAEDYVNWFRHSHGMETLILRLSNGYGYPSDPWVNRWTLIFNDLCMQAVQNGEIKLRTSGTQQRDFVSLTDVARGVCHLLALPSSKWGDGLFNFGGDCSLSIIQVARAVAAEYRHCYGKDLPVITGTAEDIQVDGPLVYSVDKLKATGFSLVGNMSEEVRRTFEMCNQLHSQGKEVL